jgi:hypothetical protein
LILFDYHKEGNRKLERILSDFLLGPSAEGKAKALLLAWDKITKQKMQERLGIHPMIEKARLFKIRNASKLMGEWDRKLMWMAKDLIRQGLNTGTDKVETTGWSKQELLLEQEVSIQSKTL